jgi:hypothetical protein
LRRADFPSNRDEAFVRLPVLQRMSGSVISGRIVCTLMSCGRGIYCKDSHGRVGELDPDPGRIFPIIA